MLQDFRATSRPETGPPRLAALRQAMAAIGLDGFLVPRADAHQGETVAPRDERLAWLTGFTGSAGHAAVTAARAVLFVDGRYRLQARAQVDPAAFEIARIPEDGLADWLKAALPRGARLGFDPWLHTPAEIERLRRDLADSGIAVDPVDNPLDRVWQDQPPPPAGRISVHPDSLAGRSHAEKRAALAEGLRAAGLDAQVITLPDSLCWLLNLRGADVARAPLVHGFAILAADGAVTLFTDPAKLDAAARAHLGEAVTILPPEKLGPALAALTGRVGVDRDTAPVWIAASLEAGRPERVWHRDPCILPKARKTPAEIAGARAAHRRDGAVMAGFLAWLDAAAPSGGLSEIAVVRELEARRRATGQLRDIAFDTICGAGANGAIVHYRVTEATDRPVAPGSLLLVDSGAQYPDGTTDITRTIAIGPPDPAAIRPFTLVLKGMIAIATARWPEGLTGRDLDPLARAALWRAGLDYDHGTGHGVGSYLSVHEGPASLSRRSTEPLAPGMILSDEPGYYREGAFGIRIENLLVVTPPTIPEGGERPMLGFETLTLAPIDRRLIDPGLLDDAERAWLDAYHARVAAEIAPLIEDGPTRAWLEQATRPLAG